jgi:hypothetical protein
MVCWNKQVKTLDQVTMFLIFYFVCSDGPDLINMITPKFNLGADERLFLLIEKKNPRFHLPLRAVQGSA